MALCEGRSPKDCGAPGLGQGLFLSLDSVGKLVRDSSLVPPCFEKLEHEVHCERWSEAERQIGGRNMYPHEPFSPAYVNFWINSSLISRGGRIYVHHIFLPVQDKTLLAILRLVNYILSHEHCHPSSPLSCRESLS